MPNVARLVELADVFDCDIADLLTEVSSRPSDQARHIARLLSGLSAVQRQWVELLARAETEQFAVFGRWTD